MNDVKVENLPIIHTCNFIPNYFKVIKRWRISAQLHDKDFRWLFCVGSLSCGTISKLNLFLLPAGQGKGNKTYILLWLYEEMGAATVDTQ